MKKYSYIYSVILIFMIMFLTIGFSAFNLEMNVDDILSYYKAPSEIRVTGLVIDSVENNGLSISEDYGVDSISIDIDLPEEQSSITYLVDVTNLGGTYMVISSLDNLPDNLTYEFNNYDLNHVICDENNQCTLGITKQISLTIKYIDSGYDSSNTTYNLNLSLGFEEFGYTIYYDSGFGLPGEFQEVEYIESTGSQRLNTNYAPKTNTVMELDLSFSGSYGTTGGNAFLNTKEDDYTFSFNYGSTSAQYNTIFPWMNKTYASGATIKSFVITDTIRTNRNTLKYSQGKVTYGSVSKTTDTNTHNYTTPIYLFGTSSSNFSRYDMKVYRLKFYEGSELIADFIPCYRTSDGVAGLYDIVGRYFVSSVTTSNFNVGEDKFTPELESNYFMEGQVVRYSESAKLKYNTYVKKDYMFVNWNTKKDGSGETYNNRELIQGLFDTSGEELHLYAQWDIAGLLGDGTHDSPYLINKIEDLIRMSNIVNNGSSSFIDEYLLMTDDLDFKNNDSYINPFSKEFGDINGDGFINTIKEELSSGLGFPPIAKTNYFSGSFDGGGHKLSNLYIHNSNVGVDGEELTGAMASGYIGLFSKVKTGNISNLEVSGSIYSDISLNMGGIVGYVSTGVLDGLKNKVKIEYNVNSNTSLGGIVAVTTGTTEILNSSNHVSISNINTKVANQNTIGGIVSRPGGNVLIRNSYNEGELKNGWRLGGIASGVIYSDATVVLDNCYNLADVSSAAYAPSGENMHIGGLVGLVWSDVSLYIINSYNTGKITTKPKKDVAGLVGASTSDASLYILNSYNVGEIIGNKSNGTYSSGIVNYSGSTANELIMNNVFNFGKISEGSYKYSIAYLSSTSYDISNTYYNEITAGSNKTIGSAIDASEFNSQEFVDTLNSNISSIDLDSVTPLKLATSYDVSLCEWYLENNIYPELSCE